ncbi:uncharacterized protein LOC142871022 [Microcebus murinus]|uniref:uncharacterized protein LOC142871022 n=1 Tax=Microcebus murinus TaxID=30608 RepID=UPI003F6B4691
MGASTPTYPAAESGCSRSRSPARPLGTLCSSPGALAAGPGAHTSLLALFVLAACARRAASPPSQPPGRPPQPYECALGQDWRATSGTRARAAWAPRSPAHSPALEHPDLCIPHLPPGWEPQACWGLDLHSWGGEATVGSSRRRNHRGCRPGAPSSHSRSPEEEAGSTTAPDLQDLGRSHVTTEAYVEGAISSVPWRSHPFPRPHFLILHRSLGARRLQGFPGLADQAQTFWTAWETPGRTPGAGRAQTLAAFCRNTSLSADPEGPTLSKPRRGQRIYKLSTYNMEGSVWGAAKGVIRSEAQFLRSFVLPPDLHRARSGGLPCLPISPAPAHKAGLKQCQPTDSSLLSTPSTLGLYLSHSTACGLSHRLVIYLLILFF